MDSGSIRKATLDGTTYDVMADANITFNRNKYEKEGIASSGRTRMKATRRVQTIEGLTLAVTPSEMEGLNRSADKVLENITMSLELADGSVYRATGQVYFENYESENGQASVTLIPDRDWTPFLA